MKISFVIPCYNAGSYLKAAIQSVQMQKTDFNYEKEIIVIDDGSTDGCLEGIDEKAVIVLRQDHGYAAKARNRGIEAASGDFIFLLDADDLLTDTAVQNLSAPFLTDTSLSAVFSRSQEFISEELTEAVAAKIAINPGPIPGTLPGCSLIRKCVFDTVGGFDTTLSSGETVDWMVRFRSSGQKSIQIDSVTLKRRVHLTNTGRLHTQEEMKNYARIMLKKMREGRK